MNTTRSEYIDYAKGFGIMLVMWAHINSSGPIATYIYFFHMPLFFFISGMLFNRSKYNSFAEFVKRKAKGLLLPYAIYSVATWVVWCGYNLVAGNSVDSYWWPLLQTLIAQGSQGYLVHNTALWFVPCLFVIEMIYYWLSKLPKAVTVLCCCGLAILNIAMVRIVGSTWEALPFNLDTGFMAIVFLMAGNMLTESVNHARLQQIVSDRKLLFGILAITLFAFLIACLPYGERISMGHSNYGSNIPMFYARAFIGTAMIIILSLLRTCYKDCISSKYIKWAGRLSFDFMSLNVPIKGFMIVIWAKLIHIDQLDIWTNSVNSIVPFILTVSIASVLTYFINKYIRKA